MNQIQFTVGVASALTEASSPYENYIRSQKSNSYSVAASDRYTLRLEHDHCRSP